MWRSTDTLVCVADGISGWRYLVDGKCLGFPLTARSDRGVLASSTQTRVSVLLEARGVAEFVCPLVRRGSVFRVEMMEKGNDR